MSARMIAYINFSHSVMFVVHEHDLHREVSIISNYCEEMVPIGIRV